MAEIDVTPAEVQRRLLSLVDLLERQVRDAKAAAIRAAEAEAAHRQAVATAQLRTRSLHAHERLTEATVEAHVVQDTAEELHERLVTAALHEAARDALHATRARIDGLRTIATSMRAEMAP